MKIKALRRKFGIEGYGVYVMMLEIIAGSDYFEYIIDDDDIVAWEIFSGDIDIDLDHLKNILEYMIVLGLLIREGNKFYSYGLKKRLQQVVQKRGNSRKSEKEEIRVSVTETPEIGVSVTETPISVTETPENGISVTESTQRKEKEIKGNKIKEKETQVPACVFSFISDFWNHYPKKTHQLEAEDFFANLSESEKQEISDRLPKWLAYWKTIEVRYVPAPDKFLSGKQWRDEIPKVYPKSKPPENTDDAEVFREKEEAEAIWNYFLSLDEDYRNSIEERISKSFVNIAIRNPESLIRSKIIVEMRNDYLRHKAR